MKVEEFNKEYEKGYHFFLSELKSITEKDLAFIVELTRASQHIKDIKELFLQIVPEEENEEKELLFYVKNDSLITMLFNISTAQLREALKLFWNFSKQDYFKQMMEKISQNNKKLLAELIELNDEFEGKKGFIYDVLLPLRNLVFHYDSTDAEKWIKQVKEIEHEEKPPNQSVNLTKNEFGLGKEYDKHIYSKNLFWGQNGFKSLMKNQEKVWIIQNKYIEMTKIIVEYLLFYEKIR